jgi:hypothetical protein
MSNSNNHNSNSAAGDKVHQETSDILKMFLHATRRGIWDVIKQAPSAWRGAEAHYYRDERRIIEKHTDPLYQGILASCVLFFTFRVSGSAWYRQIYTRYFGKTSASQTLQPTVEQKTYKGYLQQQAEETRSKMEHVKQLPFDGMLSLFCGVSASIFLFRPADFRNDLQTAPLLPGKSLVYSHLCPQYEATFQSIPKSDWDRRSPDKWIDAFAATLQSCQARASFIDHQRNVGAAYPDVIPINGIRKT